MGLIIILILLGMFLLAVELVLLPGISLAGIAALVSCGFGVWWAWEKYDTTGGIIALIAVLVLSIITIAICLKARTWKKFALKDEIDGRSRQLPEENGVAIGDKGTTVTRLAPIGKVIVGGRTFEAKSIDSYIDHRRDVEVVGFDNFTIIVKIAESAPAPQETGDVQNIA